MIPIGLLSLITFYIFFDRLFALYKANTVSRWTDQVLERISLNDLEGAIAMCDSKPNKYSSKIIDKALKNIDNISSNIEPNIQLICQNEIYNLEKRVHILGTISSIGPMLGFLGTVTGMIQSFMVMSRNTYIDPKLLSSGIYEAMVTTAAGLVVGLLAKVTYNFIMANINDVIYKVEDLGIQLINSIQKIKK